MEPLLMMSFLERFNAETIQCLPEYIYSNPG